MQHVYACFWPIRAQRGGDKEPPPPWMMMNSCNRSLMIAACKNISLLTEKLKELPIPWSSWVQFRKFSRIYDLKLTYMIFYFTYSSSVWQDVSFDIQYDYVCFWPLRAQSGGGGWGEPPPPRWMTMNSSQGSQIMTACKKSAF